MESRRSELTDINERRQISRLVAPSWQRLVYCFAALASLFGCTASEPPSTRVTAPVVWGDEQDLPVSDGVNKDLFGFSVALVEDFAFVGSLSHQHPNQGEGSVYAFARVAASWREEGELFPSGVNVRQLGVSVSASERRVAIGGEGDDATLGGVWIFERKPLNEAPAGSDTAWIQSSNTIVADDEGLGVIAAFGDGFGMAVALDHDDLLVGAPQANGGVGAVFYFRKEGEAWVEKQVLTPESTVSTADGAFGSAVSMRGGLALVGAPSDQEAAPFAGAAYYFVLKGDQWEQQQKLTGLGPGVDAASLTESGFGSAVAISELALVVGAQYENLGSTILEGSASVFARAQADEEFLPVKKYTRESPFGYEFVGCAVAVTNTRALIGALGVVDAGEAVLLDGSNGWEIERTFHPNPSEPDAAFGGSVALSGAHALIGATAAGGGGRAYSVALVRGETCESAFDCDSGFCVEGVCCNTACSDGCSSCQASAKASGATGVCGPVKAGIDPKDACEGLPASSCGTTGFCDGSGSCAVQPKGTECSAGSCDGALATGAGSCDGKESCVVPRPRNCAPGYACQAGACAQKCNGDADCDLEHGFACADGTCGVVRGGECEATADCLSGDFCSRGTCCDARCDGPCQECGLDGACHELADGTAPKSSCGDGDICYGGACSPSTWCSADQTQELHADGGVRDCVATRCVRGACVERCTDSNECADGLACRPSDKTCVVDEARPAAASACSVAMPGRSGDGALGGFFALALGSLLSAHRGKRRRACL